MTAHFQPSLTANPYRASPTILERIAPAVLEYFNGRLDQARIARKVRANPRARKR